MIKINLLPAGIYEKRIIRNLAIMFAVLAMVIAGASFGYKLKLNGDIAAKTSEVDAIETKQKMVQGLKSQAKNEASKIAPIEQKVAFIESVFQYNAKWPTLYEELAKYTYEKVLYTKLTPTTNSLQIDAYTPSISDAGRFLINMYRARHIFSSVSISGLPGYPEKGGQAGSGGAAATYTAESGPLPTGVSPNLYRYGGIGAVSSGVSKAEASESRGLSFTIACTLREPITPPVPPMGGVSAAGAGAPGAVPGLQPMPGGVP